ncbi:P10 [Sclerotinia sclerotiorum mycoreovirus 4]|uniref:P10 n=1 Tax=Sclerotinia sclerotiorum mycoreovirus 4 TaxID=1840528 RepID=UPI0007C1F630|nr:P10 [Sclerotinia sclerotiorum mycoreovirus 4]ANC52168.1 P10 [Sclerotinia sclerotiorum mycoreovirus 4]
MSSTACVTASSPVTSPSLPVSVPSNSQGARRESDSDTTTGSTPPSTTSSSPSTLLDQAHQFLESTKDSEYDNIRTIDGKFILDVTSPDVNDYTYLVPKFDPFSCENFALERAHVESLSGEDVKHCGIMTLKDSATDTVSEVTLAALRPLRARKSVKYVICQICKAETRSIKHHKCDRSRSGAVTRLAWLGDAKHRSDVVAYLLALGYDSSATTSVLESYVSAASQAAYMHVIDQYDECTGINYASSQFEAFYAVSEGFRNSYWSYVYRSHGVCDPSG